ncbi:MAG: hypothetical protein ABSD31_20075 [Candidatus Binataceae bacterium]|jgi:hypothetical protein
MAQDERRLAICIKGGISLGAYEAGVLTQTLAMIANHNGQCNAKQLPPWYIDAFAGASAGAMTALGTALTLIDCNDSHLHEMWVEGADLSALAPDKSSVSADESYKAGHTLLAAGALDALAKSAKLTQVPARLTKWHGALRPGGDTIELVFTLSNLDGQPQRLDSLNDAQLGYREYADRMKWQVTIDGFGNVMVRADDARGVGQLGSTDSGTAWLAAVQAGIAAGSFPLAFAQRGLYRYPHPPEPVGVFYSDGGIFDNDPVGELINVAHDIDWSPAHPAYEDTQRRFLIVHTESVDLSVQTFGPLNQTRDLPVLDFLGKLIPAFMSEQMQSGLRGITQVNKLFDQRLQTLNRLATLAMQPASLGWQAALDVMLPMLARMRDLSDKLDLLRGYLIGDLEDVDPVLHDFVIKMPAASQMLFRDLALLFDLAYDIADKVKIDPILIAPTGPLAGDPLYAFAGFFWQTLRAFDFGRGQHDAFLAWKAIAERTREFTIEGMEEPPANDTLPEKDQNAVADTSPYEASAQVFKERVKKVMDETFEELENRAKGLAALGINMAQLLADVGLWLSKF